MGSLHPSSRSRSWSVGRSGPTFSRQAICSRARYRGAFQATPRPNHRARPDSRWRQAVGQLLCGRYSIRQITMALSARFSDAFYQRSMRHPSLLGIFWYDGTISPIHCDLRHLPKCQWRKDRDFPYQTLRLTRALGQSGFGWSCFGGLMKCSRWQSSFRQLVQSRDNGLPAILRNQRLQLLAELRSQSSGIGRAMIKSCRIEIQEIFKSSGQVHVQVPPHAGDQRLRLFN